MSMRGRSNMLQRRTLTNLTRHLFLPAACLLVVVMATPLLAAAIGADGWGNYRDSRYGFSIAYPSNIFRPDPNAQSRSGARAFISRDGTAKLLVGAFDNESGESMAQYRSYILKQSYAGADIDYAPVRKKFFVLSGNHNGITFYERVSFTCGGNVINSWAMIYPQSEKRFYDKVVEAVAKTYRPGSRSCR